MLTIFLNNLKEFTLGVALPQGSFISHSFWKYKSINFIKLLSLSHVDESVGLMGECGQSHSNKT